MNQAVAVARSGAGTRPPARGRRGQRTEWSPSRLRIYGPLVLALFLLFGSRWGSYIFPGPPYIADLSLALLAGAAIIDVALKRGSGRGRLDATIAMLGAAFLAWSLVRFGFGSFDLEALRDLAPYAYVVIVFLTFPFTKKQEAVASRLITIALVAHAAWVSVTLTVGRLPWAPTLPAPSRGEEGLFVFDLRPDLDITVCGLLAAISLHRALAGRSVPVNLGLAAWGAALALSMDSRAGLLAVLVQLLVVAMLGPVRRRHRQTAATARPEPEVTTSPVGPRLVIAALIVAAPLALYAARDTTVVERLANTFTPTESQPLGSRSSFNTTTARISTWSQSAAWLTDDGGRTIVGVGLGDNWLADTGIQRSLIGETTREEVRSPHNYLLGTWARLGIVGVTVYILLVLAAARLAFRVANASDPLRDTDLLAILVAVSIPVGASVGVLMESPFGAIPYFWAIGHLSVRATQLGTSRTFSDLLSPPLPQRPSARKVPRHRLTDA